MVNAFGRPGLAGKPMGQRPQPGPPALGPTASFKAPPLSIDAGPDKPAGLPLPGASPNAPSPSAPAGQSYALGDPSSQSMIQRWAAILKQNGMNQTDPLTGQPLMAGQMPDAAPPQSLPDRAPMNILPPQAAAPVPMPQPRPPQAPQALPPMQQQAAVPYAAETGGPAQFQDRFPAAVQQNAPPMMPQQAAVPFLNNPFDPNDPNNPENRLRLQMNAASPGAIPSPYG